MIEHEGCESIDSGNVISRNRNTDLDYLCTIPSFDLQTDRDDETNSKGFVLNFTNKNE